VQTPHGLVQKVALQRFKLPLTEHTEKTIFCELVEV
jgi:hypothetical protein